MDITVSELVNTCLTVKDGAEISIVSELGVTMKKTVQTHKIKTAKGKLEANVVHHATGENSNPFIHTYVINAKNIKIVAMMSNHPECSGSQFAIYNKKARIFSGEILLIQDVPPKVMRKKLCDLA
jgi:hypothetical protein